VKNDERRLPILFPKDYGGEGEEICPWFVIRMRGKTRLDTDIIQVFVQVPALFYRNLGKQHPGSSLMNQIEAVNPYLDRQRVIARFHGRKSGYLNITNIQLIFGEGGEAGVPKGGFHCHGPNRSFQAFCGYHTAYTTSELPLFVQGDEGAARLYQGRKTGSGGFFQYKTTAIYREPVLHRSGNSFPGIFEQGFPFFFDYSKIHIIYIIIPIYKCDNGGLYS
jgi:hypothetical protein